MPEADRFSACLGRGLWQIGSSSCPQRGPRGGREAGAKACGRMRRPQHPESPCKVTPRSPRSLVRLMRRHTLTRGSLDLARQRTARRSGGDSLPDLRLGDRRRGSCALGSLRCPGAGWSTHCFYAPDPGGLNGRRRRRRRRRPAREGALGHATGRSHRLDAVARSADVVCSARCFR